MNVVDIVIIVALGAAVALIVRRMVRNRRKPASGSFTPSRGKRTSLITPCILS